MYFVVSLKHATHKPFFTTTHFVFVTIASCALVCVAVGMLAGIAGCKNLDNAKVTSGNAVSSAATAFEVSDITMDEDIQEADSAPISESQLQKFTQECNAIANRYGNCVSVVCEDGCGRWKVEANGACSRPSASMIKLVVLGAFLEKVSEGTVSLDDSVVVNSSQIVGGTGVIQNYGGGSSWTYRELVDVMITDSDNVAANILIDEVGFDGVNDYASRIGLTATQLNRKMMDFNAISAGIENQMSADDISHILTMIYQGSLVNQEMSNIALQALERQNLGSALSQNISAEVVFAHKTGTLPGIEHDGGLVLADAPFTLVVMTENMSASDSGVCMSEIAAKACEWLI